MAWSLFVLLFVAPLYHRLVAQQDTKPGTLKIGQPIERELSGGQAHSYQLTLSSGQFVHLSVEQNGIDLVVKFFAPDGTLIIEVDSPNGKNGPEPVRVITETAGAYRLEVSSLEKDAPLGRYQAMVIEQRAAVQSDRDLLAARHAFDEGGALHALATRESLTAALSKYDESLALYRRAAEQTGQLTVLLNQGAAYRLLGEFTKALGKLDQATEIARALNDKQGQGQALRTAAAIYRNLGDYDHALRVTGDALNLYQVIADTENESTMLKEMGEIYSFLGEQEKAREYYDQAIQLYRKLGNKNGEASTLHALGYSFTIQEDWPKTLDHFRRALAIWKLAKNQPQEAIEESFVGLEYARAGVRQEAIEHAAEALRLRPTGGDFNEATVLTNVGNAYGKLGEFEKAQGYFTTALKIWRTIGDKRGEAITLRHWSFALRGQGRLAEARTKIQDAMSLLELMRDHAGTPQQKASFVAGLFDFYEYYIDLMMRMHAADPKAGFDLAALSFSEKVKLRSLKELLTSGRVDLSDGTDRVLLERERSANDRITASLDKLTKLLRGKFTEAQKIAAEKELELLQAERRQLLEEMRQRDPRYSALTEPQQQEVSEIQKQVLDGNTILLEFALGRERSYLWAVTPEMVQSYELPSKAVVTAQALRVYQLLTARQPARGMTANQQRAREAAADMQYQTESVKLSDLLLGPVAAQLGTKRLLIVADGALQYLPFAVLPAPAKSGAERSAEPKPLIVDHEIVSLPSASVLSVLRREFADRKPAPKSVAVLADPVYELEDARVRSRRPTARPTSLVQEAQPGSASVPPSTTPARASRDGLELRRLLFSRDEAEAIMSNAPARTGLMALDFRANRALAMSDELSKYRILHFSSHGLLDSRRPELSGLVLSLVNAAAQPQEGFLRLHEIYNLRLNADLVVLSACQTGLGKDVRGEGLIGLTRGFMYAGVPRVVASLWEVDDAATTELMKRFYRGLMRENLPAAAALRAAQIEMLNKKHWQSPYYWGAFVLQGEWK